MVKLTNRNLESELSKRDVNLVRIYSNIEKLTHRCLPNANYFVCLTGNPAEEAR